jgi:electron transport complex protein RnfE
MSSKPLSALTAGVWRDNPALVQLLGLCPLLAVSTSAINGLTLGIATLVTVVLSNVLTSSVRHWLIAEVRIPIFVLLIAGCVTCIDLIMNAWWHDLYLTLGIFIPLIITNCAILARAESFASRNGVITSLADGIANGLGFALVLTVLGSIREVLGQGTLLSGADLLFGAQAAHWQLTLSEHFTGLLVALLPPGAFILFGLMLAVRNLLANAATQRHSAEYSAQEAA